MKIICASVWDPRDPSSWSGSALNFTRALAAQPGVTLEYAAPLEQRLPLDAYVRARFYRLLGKNYLPDVDPRVLDANAAQVAARLRTSDADVILSLDKMPIAHLQADRPVVYFWDCTWEGNLEYPWFAALARESIEYGHLMEKRTIENCGLAIFSSEWARESAIRFYGSDRAKTHVIPLGANLEVSRTAADIEQIVDARSREVVHLLWLGVDWKRKGGDMALEVAQQLNERGIATVLTVVGCTPELEDIPPFVRALGFIDKTRQRNLIDQLFSSAHFMILPSIAEASACVMCEASSFGTPTLSRQIGGIPGTVRGGINGKLFHREAPAANYADYVAATLSDWHTYQALCFSSFREYNQKLNWENTARTMVQLIGTELLAGL